MAIVYCPLVHLEWSPSGRLRTWGYIDFAGGLPVEACLRESVQLNLLPSFKIELLLPWL